MKAQKICPPIRLFAVVVVMAAMLMGAVGPVSAQTNPTINAQLCLDLDTNDNLQLSQIELNALAGAPFNADAQYIAEVSLFCDARPSISVDPSNNGDLTIIKRFCEADNSANANSDCNGRVEGVPVTFTVTSGTTSLGTVVFAASDFTLGNGGQATEGSKTSADIVLTVGQTYLVCEIAPVGFDAVPRPGSVDGSDQTGISDCISVVAGPGNNVLQFNNFQVPMTPSPTPTKPVVVVNPTKPVVVVATTAPAAAVTVLPSTGTGTSQADQVMFAVAGIAALALMAVGIRRYN